MPISLYGLEALPLNIVAELPGLHG